MAVEAEMSKIKGPADSVSDEGLLPGSFTAVFCLCSHMAEATKEISWVFHKATNHIYGGSALIT